MSIPGLTEDESKKRLDVAQNRESIMLELGIISRTKAQLVVLEQEWLSKQKMNGAVCDRCGKSHNLTVDHILPRNFLIQLGIDILRHFDPQNLQVLCRACNAFKGGYLDFANPKTKILLIKYIEPL